jgi:hypothetical protein
MGALVLPTVLRQQPQQALAIDRSNPLARGLISVFVGSQAYDPVSGRQFINSTSGNRTVGPMGYGVDGRIGQAKVFPVGPSLSTGSLFVVVSTTDPSTEQIIAEIGPDGSFTDGVRGLRFVNGKFTTYVRNFFDLSTNSTYGVGMPMPVGVTYAGAATSIYVNGKLDASGTTSNTASTADTFNLGGITGQTSYNVRGSIPVAFAWSRVLSAAEMASLADNPWQLFKAPARRLWVTAVQAQVATASMAWTEGSESMSIIGALVDRSAITWVEGNEVSTVGAIVTDNGALAWTEQGDVHAITVAAASPPMAVSAALSWAEADDSASFVARLTNRAALAVTEQGDTWALTAYAERPPVFKLTVRFDVLRRDFRTKIIHFSN